MVVYFNTVITALALISTICWNGSKLYYQCNL